MPDLTCAWRSSKASTSHFRCPPARMWWSSLCRFAGSTFQAIKCGENNTEKRTRADVVVQLVQVHLALAARHANLPAEVVDGLQEGGWVGR